MTGHTAVCRLLFHPDTSLPAEVLGQDNSRGLLRGQSYTSLALTTVPRDASLKKNQSVVTVADEQTPQGLLIGTIDHINNAKNEAYQEATLSVPYSPDDLRAVTILVAP
jgi:cell shape-determining protein MreC